MTLPELLITMSVIGIISASLAMATSVTLRATPSTEGRLNVARSEQDLAFWVPPDLASAETVVTDPAASPCGPDCPTDLAIEGSNALLLTWLTKGESGGVAIDIEMNVSYRYVRTGDEYQLVRIECAREGTGAPVCSSNVVLHNLIPPPNGATFVPGITIPNWVIQVTEPLAPDAIDDSETAGDDYVKDANRVVVTVNGGGISAGAGGGVNQISITAGGTNRTTIESTSVDGAPSFAEARSRCGGPLTLIVDESNSIDSEEMTRVRQAVLDFIDTLDGTPVSLQVVRFATEASILGDGSAWHRYFDMTDSSDVAALRSAAAGLNRNGGTNWEDAWFRTFYESDGTTANTIPNTVIFFTDGVPTFNRLVHRDTDGVLPAVPEPLPDPWPEANGYEYNQEAFNRTDFIAGLFRSSVRLVGVGVGEGIAENVTWLSQPSQGYHYEYERGYHQYQRGYHWERQGRRGRGNWRQVYSAPYDYWDWIDGATYDANNVSADASDGYRDAGKEYSSPYLDWEPSATGGGGSGYRSVKVYTEPYDHFDTLETETVTGRTVLARLIAGNDYGVEALLDGTGNYTNAEEADMFTVPDWDDMPEALKAIALGECGGTVTIQSKLSGGGAVQDPITYQNVRVLDSSGTVLAVEPSIITTSQRFATGTFDFEIADGQYIEVEIQPQNLADLTGYTPAGWACRSGGLPVPGTDVEEFTIPDSSFKGVRLKVRSNQAVSCTMTVVAS